MTTPEGWRPVHVPIRVKQWSSAPNQMLYGRRACKDELVAVGILNIACVPGRAGDAQDGAAHAAAVTRAQAGNRGAAKKAGRVVNLAASPSRLADLARGRVKNVSAYYLVQIFFERKRGPVRRTKPRGAPARLRACIPAYYYLHACVFVRLPACLCGTGMGGYASQRTFLLEPS